MENTNKQVVKDDILKRAEVEKMITEAKYEIAKGWIYLLLAIFGIFGVFIPFGIALFQANRVENSIDKMESNFKELAGKQLRKPQIVCKINNAPLLDNVLCIKDRNASYFIDIYNEGDGVSGPIDVYVYLKKIPVPSFSFSVENYHDWKPMPSENQKYPYKYAVKKSTHLSPNDGLNINFDLYSFFAEVETMDIEAMLKVFYGESKPIEVPFVLRFEKEKPQIKNVP
jgi:hypothetical protein